MTQGSQFWGTFVGREIDLENKCEFYVDMSVLGGGVNDNAGVAGGPGGAIQSAATFGEWFTNVLGTNLSKPHTITMTRVAGVYEYLDDGFHPIDAALYGNEGQPNNHYFTYEIDATFTYEGCAGQFVEFAGADDMWLFIDGNLVMDLGGIQPMTPQHLDLDRLGLSDATEYDFKLFYAQRTAASSSFRLRTDLVLSTGSPLDISAVFD
jgi:fibro-slime domain-containing protein